MANPNPSPATRWKAGERPAGAGRPKEARDRLTRKFLNDLADDFEKHGTAAIVSVRENDPGRYIAAVAAVIPKEIEITRPLDGMDDSQLAQAIETLAAALRLQAPIIEPEPEQPTVN